MFIHASLRVCTTLPFLLLGFVGVSRAQDSTDDLQSVKLKEADLDHRVIVSDTAPADAAWTYQPDESDAPKKLSRERSIRLPSYTSTIAFSSRSDDLAAALTTASSIRDENGLRIREETWSLHPFRPSTGESLPSIELGAHKMILPPRESSLKNRKKRLRTSRTQAARDARAERLSTIAGLFAIGDGLAVLKTNSAGRVDVWSLKDRKHWLAWKPYNDETFTRKSPQWMTVLPDNRVLTLNYGGRLICWQLPKCRATYERDLGQQSTLVGLQRLGIFTTPGLSPNRRHLAAWSGSSLLLLDTSSGKRLAVLRGQSRPGLMRPTFSPDGLQLAYTEQYQGAEELVLYDLKKGRELSRIQLPPDTWPRIGFSNNFLGGFTWASKRYGVVSSYMVIDLVEERPVWRFNASDRQPSGRTPCVSLSGPGYWYFGRTPNAALNAVEITADQQPQGGDADVYAVAPGATIQVVSKIDAPKETTEALLDSLTQRLAQLEFKTGKKSRIKLVIESVIDETYWIKKFPPGSQSSKLGKQFSKATANMPGVSLKVSVDVRGKTAWSKSTWYLPQLSELHENTPRDVAIAQQWAGIVKYSPQSFFARIPGYIANPDGGLPKAPYPLPLVGR